MSFCLLPQTSWIRSGRFGPKHALQALRKAQLLPSDGKSWTYFAISAVQQQPLKPLKKSCPEEKPPEGMARWLNKFVEYRLYMPALARGLKLIKGRNGLADEEAFKELKAAGLAHEEKDLVLLQLFAGENLVAEIVALPPPPPPKPAPLPLINHEVLRLLSGQRCYYRPGPAVFCKGTQSRLGTFPTTILRLPASQRVAVCMTV